MLKLLKRFSTYTLLVALVISAISAYYSIVGLTAIFAAAVTPIIIMGAALELGKLTAAVWLKLNWQRAPLTYKFYLVPAVAFLMALTSMGIFGFLSKAHSDQSLVSGDSQAKIAIYDEKIKVEKDNIDANRKALKQMDEAVDQVMGRSSDEKGAEKAVQIRRGQQKERSRLLSDIEAEQKKISQLMEDRAPLAAENRKIESEVGPIKYIAALIYEENPDSNVLEKAVRFVIIMIVAVFDPLALVLILAAQQSMRWEREEEKEHEQGLEKDVEQFFDRTRQHAKQLDEEKAFIAKEVADILPEAVLDENTTVDYSKHTYLNEPFVHFKDTKPMVATKTADEVTWPEVSTSTNFLSEEELEHLKTPLATTISPPSDEILHVYDDERLVSNHDKKILAVGVDVVDRPGDYVTQPIIETEGVTNEIQMFDPRNSYVNYEGKSTSIAALKSMRPDLILPADGTVPNKVLWSSDFPRNSLSGDIHIRVDSVPHSVFKFNGNKWIQLNKAENTSYLQNSEYVTYLIDKINSGEYDPELLTEAEEEEITRRLSESD